MISNEYFFVVRTFLMITTKLTQFVTIKPKLLIQFTIELFKGQSQQIQIAVELAVV